MKITKKKVVFFLIHAIFSAILPITLVMVRYSTIGNTRDALDFKISITGILLMIFLFWTIKRLFIDRKLEDLNAQKNLLIANLKTKQDSAELSAIVKELKNIKTIEVIFDSILPLLFLVAAIVAFRALEAQIVTLSSSLGLISVSYTIGFVFNVLQVREIHTKKEGDKL